ncbi:MAG: hypothetical protein AAFP84_03990 [Actinomycetota bacterium]
MELGLEFCGESVDIDALPFSIGREADFVVDDNPYLHRRFLQLFDGPDGTPMLANVGSQLTATLSDPGGRMEAMLGPGASLPVLYGEMLVRFTAGSTQYELTLERAASAAVPDLADAGEPGTGSLATVGRIELTEDQTLLVLSIAESALRSGGSAVAQIPTTAESARRIGWKTTKYNRKLDNVCEKLARHGVRGLHGDSGSHASNRKARLVEYVLTSRIVTKDDLRLLDDAIARTDAGQ